MPDTPIGFYGHVRQYHDLKEELNQAIHEVLESGTFVLGPRVKQFETELAAYCKMKHAVGVNSGTDALWLTLLALGVGSGDEVITTSNTFFATAEAVWFVGATPVFVDINPKTRNMDPDLIEAALSPKTKAIIPVHLYGQPAEMRKISAVAQKHKLFVIEDCAQALGARGDDFSIGELSDAVCTSFIIQKNLGCFGDGGAVVTNHAAMTAEIAKLRNHGSPKRSHHSMGYNSRLDEIHAATLSVKLRQLDRWNDRRIEIAKQYDAAFAATSLQLPYTLPGYRSVNHLYVVETDGRDALQSHLDAQGIKALTHYPIAIHQQEGFPFGRPARISGSLQHTERSAARVLSLPMYPELTDEEVKRVIEATVAWDKTRAGKAQKVAG
jgi:dTDP-4-amino-4,6-dideoxygalactose transaminase